MPKSNLAMFPTRRQRHQYSPEFEAFWKVYPATNGFKRDKVGAYAEWEKQGLNDWPGIIKALRRQIRIHKARRQAGKQAPEFPYAVRWIKRKCWNDEVEA